jgi:hypothetical protein
MAFETAGPQCARRAFKGMSSTAGPEHGNPGHGRRFAKIDIDSSFEYEKTPLLARSGVC